MADEIKLGCLFDDAQMSLLQSDLLSFLETSPPRTRKKMASGSILTASNDLGSGSIESAPSSSAGGGAGNGMRNTHGYEGSPSQAQFFDENHNRSRRFSQSEEQTQQEPSYYGGEGDIAPSPIDYDGSGNGNFERDHCEIFCGKIPKLTQKREVYELFEQFGRITSFRLLKAPGQENERGNPYLNRGYAFIEYETKADAERAIQELSNYEIRENSRLHVDYSKPNLRLFVGNIPKSKEKLELFREFSFRTHGLKDVIIYPNIENPDLRNRGFCFLEYGTRRDATAAKQKLTHTSSKIWGCDVIVDWADPVAEPKPEDMEKVTVLYVRNLRPNVTEEEIYNLFAPFGFVDRVKKIKDYAFVHFDSRENAARALENLNENTELQGSPISVQWSKPPMEKHFREKILHNRERRMHLVMARRDLNQEQVVPNRRDQFSARTQHPREFGDYNEWQSNEEDLYDERRPNANAWNVPFQHRHRTVWTRSTGQRGDSASASSFGRSNSRSSGFYDNFGSFDNLRQPSNGNNSYRDNGNDMGRELEEDSDFPSLSSVLQSQYPSGSRGRPRTRRF